MNTSSGRAWLPLSIALIITVCVFGLYASSAAAAGITVTLSGDQEVPSVKTMGSGQGAITVGSDRSVSGSVITKDVPATAAHIHEGAAGKNGGVIITLTKSGDDTWMVPPGAKLTAAQYESFKAGGLYINVHTQANPGGEVRGQLNP